jgi:hypothetical protein
LGVPATGNICFSSLSSAPVNVSTLVGYLPAVCLHGGGNPPPPLSIGDNINVVNGLTSSLLVTIKDCVDNHNLRDWVVPTIACGQCNSGAAVTGFVAVHIDSVSSSGANKGIFFHTVCGACGDGFCNGTKDCTSCAGDCGGCPATCP